MGKPVLTMRMNMHLNYGGKGSSMHYVIAADGKDTHMYRIKKTERPNYKIVSDEIYADDEVFDIMNTKVEAIEEWVINRIKKD